MSRLLYALNVQRFEYTSRPMDLEISSMVSNMMPPDQSDAMDKLDKMVNLYLDRPTCIREMGVVDLKNSYVCFII